MCHSGLSCVVQAIVDDPLMRHSAVLVFANKQDLVGSHSISLLCLNFAAEQTAMFCKNVLICLCMIVCLPCHDD